MPRVPDSVSELFEAHKGGEAPTEKLMTALYSVLKLVGEAFITIDALDECSLDDGERKRLLTFLTELSVWALPNVHLLITSQEVPDIKEKVQPLLTIPPIRIEPGPDILTHIQSQLANDSSLAGWDPAVKDEIEKTLVNGANGVYEIPSQH